MRRQFLIIALVRLSQTGKAHAQITPASVPESFFRPEIGLVVLGLLVYAVYLVIHRRKKATVTEVAS